MISVEKLGSQQLFFVTSYRKYLQSGWCKEEFSLAYLEVVEGRHGFIILLMLDDLKMENLPDEMQKYVKTRTYIEVKNMELYRKKLLYAMPSVPLRKCKEVSGNKTGIPALYNRFYKYSDAK